MASSPVPVSAPVNVVPPPGGGVGAVVTGGVGVGVVSPVPGLVYSRRFGEPVPALVTTPLVAWPVSAEATVAGDAPGLVCRYRAAAPVTCGVAIEVPLMVFVAVFEVSQDEVMFWPGA